MGAFSYRDVSRSQLQIVMFLVKGLITGVEILRIVEGDVRVI